VRSSKRARRGRTVSAWPERWLLVGALAALPSFAAPPAVHLQVELRFVDVATSEAANGAFVVGTRGGTAAAAGSYSVRTERRAGDEVLQVSVLNGARATLHASRLRALPAGEWMMGGDRPGFAQTRVWVEAGRGFTVQPRWPGGADAVQVEIGVEGDERVASRLTVAPGAWTTCARLGSGVSATALQIRVQPPP